jgi:hypothetical protein
MNPVHTLFSCFVKVHFMTISSHTCLELHTRNFNTDILDSNLGKLKRFIYLSYNSVQSEESGGSSSLKGSPVCWAHSHSHILVLCLGQPVAVHHCKASLSYLHQQGIILCVLLMNCIQMCANLKCVLFH